MFGDQAFSGLRVSVSGLGLGLKVSDFGFGKMLCWFHKFYEYTNMTRCLLRSFVG